MVSFDPVSLIVEGLSQAAIYFIDKDAASSISASKQQADAYLIEAEANKEDAAIYALLVKKAEKQKQDSITLANATIKQNRGIVYVLALVFLLAFFILIWVFSIVFKTKK